MINALIIDDERDARFLLRNLLDKHFLKSVTIIGEADGVETGVKAIETCHPDVVFLDINMHGGTGFDLLQKLNTIDFEVIFVTAYDNYAVKAFQFSAFGYLLKPVKISELRVLIEKLEGNLHESKQIADPRLKILIENYDDKNKIKKIVISNMEGFQVLNIEEIIRLEGDRNYTHFITSTDKKVTTSKTLGEYEELLSEHGFYRVHQSTIINLRHVKGYEKGIGEIRLSDGKNVKLSRYRKADFVKRFI